MPFCGLQRSQRLWQENILEPREREESNEDVDVGLVHGRPSVLERWVFVPPPLECSLIESVPTPLLPSEKPGVGDCDWGRIKRGPVLGEGLVVVVDLKALGANSSDILERIPGVENRRDEFSLGFRVNRRRFGASDRTGL